MKVVQSHHQVLSLWAEFRRQREQAPILFTLDHHTDTSLPFRNHLQKKFPQNRERQEEERQIILRQVSFQDAKSIEYAESLLSHDEHILTALDCNIISGAFVVAQNARDTDLEVYLRHKVCCYSVARTGLEATLLECDRVLESDFLQGAIVHFNNVRRVNGEGDLLAQDIIFDVDLDYLNTLRAVHPEDSQMYRHLYNNAGLVTVAAEPEHVLICAREDGLTSNKLLESLKQIHASSN